ncbi:diacylglycerol/lipid kinase family protein [Faecalicatena contorta]|uniref:diacylglycerol kinase (ATP) n=1 Tax=Faecalicatena contorta TaxID=39482 RepID=A0A315ZVD6_9FIRM|nr:diacylglycerol kinase family protein [Faecalicatena contorta]PWJ49475.1 YegS/Rv2252/BmrU family lipid kinase [Faecalicatena contorta]SUQ14719.1 lipid kinase, YegS/Rv2252/BmrU family [Faecalicatena contorta]
MKYNFIVNPHSRSGKGGMIWEILEPELKKRQTDYEGFLTEHPGHAITLAQQITGDGQEHVIVILGGDGTVNEVVNGIEDVEKITLGYIPTGSSNDLARGLGLPKEPLDALDVVLNSGQIQKMDIGLLTRGGKERRFAVSAGIGFDAAVCHQAAISSLKVLLNRLKLGKLTYVAIALGRLFCDNPVRAQITLDDKEAKTFERVYFAAAMNNSYEGGGFHFCPNARNDDGLLDVIVISKLPKLAVLLLLPTAYKGWHTHFPGIFVFQCRKATIETEEALAVHTDGEPIFLRKKIIAGLLGKQIRVITV